VADGEKEGWPGEGQGKRKGTGREGIGPERRGGRTRTRTPAAKAIRRGRKEETGGGTKEEGGRTEIRRGRGQANRRGLDEVEVVVALPGGPPVDDFSTGEGC
jgi:hypothetical protein